MSPAAADDALAGDGAGGMPRVLHGAARDPGLVMCPAVSLSIPLSARLASARDPGRWLLEYRPRTPPGDGSAGGSCAWEGRWLGETGLYVNLCWLLRVGVACFGERVGVVCWGVMEVAGLVGVSGGSEDTGDTSSLLRSLTSGNK